MFDRLKVKVTGMAYVSQYVTFWAHNTLTENHRKFRLRENIPCWTSKFTIIRPRQVQTQNIF